MTEEPKGGLTPVYIRGVLSEGGIPLFVHTHHFINNCLAQFPLLNKSNKPIQFANVFKKSASLNNAHQIFRKRSNRVLFSIVIYMFIHYHSDFITFFDIIMKIWLLDQ